MKDEQMSENFWLSEFTISSAADRNGIANEPDQAEIKNLRRLCELVLQPARDALGPLRINSGFRSQRLNKLVGGAPNSGHRLGHAADVVPVNASTRQFAEWVVINCKRFDQVILEFGTLANPNWIHISADPDNRRQVLRATRKGGKTVYDPVDIISERAALLIASQPPNTVSDRRREIAGQILNWEARRDKQGRLAVYQLPTGDGGGSYEVAGINVRYHRAKAAELKTLIEGGKYAQAETHAIEYIASETDVATRWTTVPAVEVFLRDCCFNRGMRGAAIIYQIALRVKTDGAVGNDTLTAAALAEKDPDTLLQRLRDARERYERKWVDRSESSKFWKGLVNRWNKCLAFSRTFL